MKEFIIEAKDIDYVYPDGTYALSKLSISLERGKKIAIVGSNGAGKTTLFLNLNGVYKPAKGKIVYNGQEIRYTKEETLALRKNIGIVFQDANVQLFSANVFQEVSFGPMNLDLPKEEVKKRVLDALEKTEVLDLKDKPTHFLSGGQKKRVAVADILAMDPNVIFLDEPTAFVDPVTSKSLMTFFDELNQEGKTLVLSSHDMDRVYPWADHVFVMKEGKIIADGLPEVIFQDNELLIEAGLDKPWIIEAYEELIKSKPHLKDERIPKTKEELFALLSK
ncbi:MAG: energy-coupling factor ABC transporter ATP-binding protein [Bacillota bacterium]